MPWTEIATLAGCAYVTVGMMAVIQAFGTGSAQRWGLAAPWRILTLLLLAAPITLWVFWRAHELRRRYPQATNAEIEALITGLLEED